jgi:hypothetical protein
MCPRVKNWKEKRLPYFVTTGKNLEREESTEEVGAYLSTIGALYAPHAFFLDK